MGTTRILLVDDHALVRAAMRVLLETIAEVEVVAEAAHGREAIRLVAAHRPHVAIVNIAMPELDGLETTRRLAKDHPETRVLILSMHADEEYVLRAMQLGAKGYLVKSAERVELELAIRAVSRGDVWLSPAVSKTVVAALERCEPAPPERLTPRQREILQLIGEGRSTKEIAQRLGVSAKTVENHRVELMRRLGVRGIPALVRSAIRLGLARVDE